MTTSPRGRFVLTATASYVVLALLWIFLSDDLFYLFIDTDSLRWFSTVKGVLFVLVSASVFFVALRAVPASDSPTGENLWGAMSAGLVVGKRHRWVAYVFAIGLTTVMLLVRLSLSGSLDNRPMLIMFMLPIILSALMGGVGPGLVATALATLGVDYLFIPPAYSFKVASSLDLLQWTFLLGNGIAVSLLSELLRRSLAKLEVNRRLLDAVVSGTSDAIFVKDLQGRYLLANPAAATYVGKPVSAIVGHDDRALFPPESAHLVMEKDREIVRERRVQTHEEKLTTHQGQSLAFLVTKGPVFDALGQVSGLFGISRDITVFKQTESALRASESALIAAQQLAGVGNWDWDIDSGVHRWSEEIYRIYGRDPALPAAVYPEVQTYFTPESWAQLASSVEDALVHGTDYECDAEVVRPDGGHRWIIARGQSTRDAAGRVVRMSGTVQDITERKLAELALQVNEERFQMAMNATSSGLWDWDIRTGRVFRSPQYYAVIGGSPEEDVGQDFAYFQRTVHPDDLRRVLDNIEAHRQGKTGDIDFEYRFVAPSGAIRWLKSKGRAVSRDAQGLPLRMVGTVTDVTERRMAEHTLREREKQLSRVMEGSDQGYWEWDLVTNAFQVSARWESMLGYTPGEIDVSVENWPKLVHPEDMPLAEASIERHLAGKTPLHEVEFRARTKSGGWAWILTRGRVVEWDNDGQPTVMAGTHTDINERKMFELAQKEASTVFESSYEGIMVANPLGLFTKVNPAFTRITGYTLDEVVGKSPSLLSSGRHDAAFYKAMWDGVLQHDFWRGEVWNRRKSGEIYAELLSISAVRDPRGAIEHFVGVFSDISQLKAHEEELDRIAHYDPLTGAPNRRLLADRLGQAIIHASRSGRSLAVCFLDLDGFKDVNDLHGHAVGDQLLIGVTESLKGVLRADDTLARLGGDEFVLLMSDIGSPEECSLILDRILHAISIPVHIGELAISVSASIGVSLYPQDHADADTLLRHADQAMYLAKDSGKNRYQLFDPESDQKAQAHRKFLEVLRLALENQEFLLYYQPKVNLIDGQVIGVEALIRWRHPDRGLLPPSQFLSFIDGSALDRLFGEWVIRTALGQLAQWNGMGIQLSVSVNISAEHLLQPDFCERLQSELQRHPQVAPEDFELEVLETAAIADMAQAVDILNRCRSLGVHFALDDFGTGYSSLTYLRKLPVDTLKIDQSFVRDMLNDADDLGIVEGVIRLARAFNRQVIAEGVETLAHGASLLGLGCHLAQGYGIARPMPPEQFADWMAQWTQERAWRTLNTDALGASV